MRPRNGQSVGDHPGGSFEMRVDWHLGASRTPSNAVPPITHSQLPLRPFLGVDSPFSYMYNRA